MADIAMCQDKRCSSRTLCYRFTAKADPYRQSYFTNSREKGKIRCDEFWSNEGTPDPTDYSVNEAPICRCNLYGMPHKWNAACQLFEVISKPWLSQKPTKVSDKKGKNVRKNRKG